MTRLYGFTPGTPGRAVPAYRAPERRDPDPVEVGLDEEQHPTVQPLPPHVRGFTASTPGRWLTATTRQTKARNRR